MAVNVVLGAGGPTGAECVKRLLEVTQDKVRAVVRDPSKYAEAFPKDARLEVVAGDVTDQASLDKALAGAKGVIFAASGKGYWSAKEVDYEGVVKTAAAAKAAGADRVVLVTSMLSDPANRCAPVRILLNNIRYSLMDYKFKSEEHLRESGAKSWVVVRPGGLTTGERGQARILADKDTAKEVGGGSISRADVAAVCVEALSNPAAANHKFSIYTKPGNPVEGDYSAHVASLFA